MSLSKVADSKKRILECLILVLLLILATALSCYRIAEPAWDWAHSVNYGGAVDGWHGSLLTEWAGVARNYLKFDYPKTGLGQAAYVTQNDPTLFHHRIDYPPLFPLLIALSFRLFGVHEWSARLIPLLSSTGLLLLVFWLGRKLGGSRVALTASFLFALLPMQVYHSTLTEPQILSSFFSLLTFAFYLQWVERRETKYYAGIYASFILGALSAWIAYFVVPAILLHYLACEYKKTKKLNFAFFFALTPLVLFGAHLGWTYILGGEWALLGLLDRFLIRTVSGGDVEGQIAFTMWDLYARGYIRAKLFLTPIVCFLSLIWFVTLVIAALYKIFLRLLSLSPKLTFGGTSRFIRGSSLHNPSDREIISRRDTFVLALFLFGLSHNLVFGNRVYLDDIIMFLHLTPLFVVVAALGMQLLVQRVLRDKWIWTVPFVLIVGYLFITQSASALEWLFDVPVLPEAYIVGSRVNEITDENAKVATSLGQGGRMRWYSNRVWSVVSNPENLASLLQADPSYSHYAFDNRDPLDRELEEYLVRNHPVENFYNYSFFDLQVKGSNVIVQDPQIEHSAKVNFDDKLMFLGYNAEEVIQKKREPYWMEKYFNAHAELMPEHRTTFRLTYFWQCLEEMEKDYALVTQFEGRHDKAYRVDQSHQGVNGAYPTSMWKPGEVIREEYQVEVPADYPPIRYTLWVGVRDREEGLEVTSDVETDEENRVRLGEIEVLPAEEPSPLAAEPRPQNRIEANINDEMVLLGYDLNDRNPQPGDQLKVTTYWQSLRGTDRDYAIQVELRNGGYKVREALDIAPTRLWKKGNYYRGDAVIAINPHLLKGTYSLNLRLERDDETVTQVSLTSLDIPCRRRHIIRRWGKANYGGSNIISMEEPLSLQFDLGEREALEVVAGWTGKAESEETRVEVYISNAYWDEKYLGTWVIESDRYMTTKRRISRTLTAPGQNVVELRLPEVPERVHNIGWRGWMDLVFPDLLQDPRTDYDGPIQMDFVQMSSRWEGDWDDYYDLAKAYAERWMMGEVARLYEEAVAEGLEPGRVDEFLLFKQAYEALGEEGKIGEIEQRITEHIAHNMNVNLGGKVEFLGYSLSKLNNGCPQMSLFFRCVEEMEEDYTLWVHGEVEDESLLEGQRREAGYAVFDHLLPTSRWQVGEVYQDDEVSGLRSGRYHFALGLWRPEDGSRLWREDDPEAHIIDLGWVEVQ